MTRIWDVLTGTILQRFEGHQSQTNGLAICPCGRFLATTSNDRTVRMWDVASGKQTHVLEGHQGYTLGVAFSPTENLLATTSYDTSICLWDATTGQVGNVEDSSAQARRALFSVPVWRRGVHAERVTQS